MADFLPGRDSAAAPQRVAIFVDFWNLALSLDSECDARGEPRWRLDWTRLPGWLALAAARSCAAERHVHVGTHVYSSFNAASPGQLRHRNWAMNWLNQQPDVTVELRRQVRRSDRCSNCGARPGPCRHCGWPSGLMTEKGVDTALATAMIEHFIDDRYDIAVLVSSDGDLAPPAQFLMQRGRMVVQAGFGPPSRLLKAACVASLDIYDGKAEIEFRGR